MTHLINKIYNKSSQLGLTLCLMLLAQINFANKLDSLRLETKGGQNFVIHKVDKGQTLYGTLRKYGCSLNDYKKANPDAEMDIKIGQVIKVPYNRPLPKPKNSKVVVEKKAEIAEPTSPKKAQTYQVEPGMTLFSVAKKHGLSVAQLKKMNGLEEDQINVGQILIVREGDKVFEVEAKPRKESDPKPVIVEDKRVLPMEKPIKKVAEKVEEKPNVPIFQKEEDVKPKPKVAEVEVEKPKVIEVEKPKEEVKKVVVETPKIAPKEEMIEPGTAKNVVEQEGIAEGIEVESKSGKYLALHKTAPIGALIQVKNATTGAAVWVKVIGRLPNIDGEDNLVIKLSPKAMSRVSPVDKKFRAKLTYSL